MAYGSFEEGGITVQSSEHSDAELAANLTPDPVVEVVEDADDEPVVVPEPKAKPRNDPQARVEAATAKEAAAKRERDEAKAERDKLAARVAELEAKPAPRQTAPVVAPTDDPAPDPKKFPGEEYDPQYMRQMARWEARQEFREQQVKSQQTEAAQQRAVAEAEVERQFGERYSAVLAEDPDFPAKVDPRLLNTPRLGVLPPEERANATFGNFLVEQVFQSEHPKELLLHLSDPSVSQRLATLHPVQVIRELAKYEYSLGAASPSGSAPKPNVSHAKPPIRPERTSPLATDANEITGEESVDDHIRKANAADRRARRAS